MKMNGNQEATVQTSSSLSSSDIPPALLRYKIPDLPDSFFYIADFLTEAEEAELLENVGHLSLLLDRSIYLPFYIFFFSSSSFLFSSCYWACLGYFKFNE